MVDLSLDLNASSLTYKDFLVQNGDLVLTSDATSSPNGNNPVLQDVIQRLNMFLGEWFMDSTQGTPWFQQILVKNPDQKNIDAILRNIILGTPGVLQLNTYSFTSDFKNRTGHCTFSILTAQGVIDYNGVVAPVFAGGQTPGVFVP